jgi:hypothetical protein
MASVLAIHYTTVGILSGSAVHYYTIGTIPSGSAVQSMYMQYQWIILPAPKVVSSSWKSIFPVEILQSGMCPLVVKSAIMVSTVG